MDKMLLVTAAMMMMGIISITCTTYESVYFKLIVVGCVLVIALYETSPERLVYFYNKKNKHKNIQAKNILRRVLTVNYEIYIKI